MTCGVVVWWSRFFIFLFFLINGSLFCLSCARAWAYGCQWCNTIPLINRWWYQTRYDALCLQTGRGEDDYKLDLNDDAFKTVYKKKMVLQVFYQEGHALGSLVIPRCVWTNVNNFLSVCKKNLHRAPLTYTGGSLLIMFCTFRGIRSAQNAYWSSFLKHIQRLNGKYKIIRLTPITKRYIEFEKKLHGRY